MPKIQNVNICGITPVSDATSHELLAQILACLKEGVTINNVDAFEAVFLAALNAAEITLSDETLAALNPMTVVVDTSTGPVEVTGTVTLSPDSEIGVNILNTPTVNVGNWNELFAGTLNVTLNGETVNVQLSAEQIEALSDQDDTDDDLRPVSVHCFNWKTSRGSGAFIGWANANEDGSFAGYTVISGTPPPENAEVTCDAMAVTSLQAIRLEPVCFKTANGAAWGYPIPIIDTGTGQVSSVTYLAENGKPFEGEVSQIDDCDCPQAKCCEPDAPAISMGAPSLVSDGSLTSFPMTSNPGEVPDFVVPFSIEKTECTADETNAKIMVPVTFTWVGHDLITAQNGTTGFNTIISGTGTYQSSNAANTFNNAGNVGTQTAGVGVSSDATRNVATRELTYLVPLGELVAGQTLTTSAFGAVPEDVTETIGNLAISIDDSVLHGVCNCG